MFLGDTNRLHSSIKFFKSEELVVSVHIPLLESFFGFLLFCLEKFENKTKINEGSSHNVRDRMANMLRLLVI